MWIEMLSGRITQMVTHKLLKTTALFVINEFIAL